MAELRPYNPTWRDRIAAALVGDARPGSARANFAEGVTGSRGLGTTGMGLVDFTPAGIPMAAQEANRSAMAGDTVGAIANAMAVIPAAKVPIAAAKGAATQGIRAYHGSPHSFDRFDMSKIGTGEGAQAYGHGLYFAENEGTARFYRDNYAKPPIDRFSSEDARMLAQNQLQAFAGDIGGGLNDLKASLSNLERRMSMPGQQNPQDVARATHLREAIGYIESGAPKGSMYEVNIRANPNDFLDWDKPLAQQGPLVQEKLAPFGLKPDLTGERVMRASSFGKESYPIMGPDGKFMASNASSFEDALAMVGGDRSKVRRVVDHAPAASSEALRQAGIPGIKYLDQGSRGAGDGSRNYVVFDDSLIEILRKYGLAGATAGMGGLFGLGAMSPQTQQPAAPPQL